MDTHTSSDHIKCDKCSDEDHEGQFCRCEDRNIRIAKERRANNQYHFRDVRDMVR